MRRKNTPKRWDSKEAGYGKKKIFNGIEQKKIHDFLKSYLLEVFSDEEYITDFRKAYEEAERVEVYGERKHLTPSLVKDWLQGLPLGCAYTTYNIVCMLLEVVTGSKDYNKINEFITNDSEIDSFYWEEMGRIIYYEGMK